MVIDPSIEVYNGVGLSKSDTRRKRKNARGTYPPTLNLSKGLGDSYAPVHLKRKWTYSNCKNCKTWKKL